MAEAEGMKLEVTWERVFELWWGCLWRFVVLALLPGMVIGYMVALVTTFIVGPMLGRPVGVLALCAITAILCVPLCKMILLTKFGTFSLALISEDPRLSGEGEGGNSH